MGAWEVAEDAFREHRARVLGALIKSLGDWELAEDALQEAFAMALGEWPGAGIPDQPAAWLTAVARNRALDRLRRERVRAEKEPAAQREREMTPEMDGGALAAAGAIALLGALVATTARDPRRAPAAEPARVPADARQK